MIWHKFIVNSPKARFQRLFTSPTLIQLKYTFLSIETGTLFPAKLSALLSSRSVSILFLRFGINTWSFFNRVVFEILVSLRYKKRFKDASSKTFWDDSEIYVCLT